VRSGARPEGGVEAREVAARDGVCHERIVPFHVSVSRRGFLGTVGMSAALLALSRLRAAQAAAPAPAAGAATTRVLSPRDARILSAVAERMTWTGDPAMPHFGDTDGLLVIDRALLQLPPDVPRQLSWALLAFEYGPPLFTGTVSTYTGLPPEQQDAYIGSWAESRFRTCRIAFQAFKNLSMLGYYSLDATWGPIHYGGPWVPRPRRVLPDA